MNQSKVLLITALVLPLLASRGMNTHKRRRRLLDASKDALRCVDYSQRKANAEISHEAAELLKGYRQCIQKHEGDVAKAKESCALYREGLERIELSNMSCSCM